MPNDLIPIDKSPEGKPEAEEALAQEAKNSITGFKKLYLRWLSPVYRYLYFRTGNINDAEDLTSVVFVKVFEGLHRYNSRGHFPAWLFTIARNVVIDFHRSTPVEESIDNVDLMDNVADPFEQAGVSDEIQRLSRLIHSLPDDEQEMIRLRFVSGLNYREIGEILHRKEDAVRKSLNRLLERLQDKLEVYHG